MKKNNEFYKRIVKTMELTREKNPLIECITNYVTVNDCANVILAVGASPIMGEEEMEISDIVSMSSCVLINMGVINPRTFNSMIIAGKKANELGIPVVLDPVGVGATPYRNQACAEILKEVRLASIRGNMSEIRALGGYTAKTKGVDASAADAVNRDNVNVASQQLQEIAKKYNCVVSATGAIDIIASAENVYCIDNGHIMLQDVTGTGCMTSALVASFCGGSDDYESATATGILFMCLAGEKAHEYIVNDGSGSGTFRTKLIDYINMMSESDIMERGKIYEA